MAEYIERDALLMAIDDAMDADGMGFVVGNTLKRYVKSREAADVAPVVHGRWIERQAPHAMGGISAKCSACYKSAQYLGNPLNYCPNCGAKMDL